MSEFNLPTWQDSPKTPITAEDLNAYTEAIKELQNRDYVVERGVSDFWTYEKWASGKAVCYGDYEYVFTDAYNMSGSYYVRPLSINFPQGLFVEIPSCGFTNLNLGGYVPYYRWQSTLNLGFFQVLTIANYNSTNQAEIGILMIGKWK